MRCIFSIGLLIMAAVVQAKSITPPSCKPIMITDESVMLSTKKPVLMLIHNLSETNLWITHPELESSASAGWSSHLEARRWSALVLTKKSFELTCIESKPGHEQNVPCEHLISVCRWSSVKILNNPSTTYWAAENLSLDALRDYLRRRGFKA